MTQATCLFWNWLRTSSMIIRCVEWGWWLMTCLVKITPLYGGKRRRWIKLLSSWRAVEPKCSSWVPGMSMLGGSLGTVESESRITVSVLCSPFWLNGLAGLAAAEPKNLEKSECSSTTPPLPQFNRIMASKIDPFHSISSINTNFHVFSDRWQWPHHAGGHHGVLEVGSAGVPR